jgi:hypothetical protein
MARSARLTGKFGDFKVDLECNQSDSNETESNEIETNRNGLISIKGDLQ